MMFFCSIVLAVFCALICVPKAHAGYLDPGTGSSLVQGLIALLNRVGRFWSKIFTFFRPGSAGK